MRRRSERMKTDSGTGLQRNKYTHSSRLEQTNSTNRLILKTNANLSHNSRAETARASDFRPSFAAGRPLAGHDAQHQPVGLVHPVAADLGQVADAAVHILLDDPLHGGDAAPIPIMADSTAVETPLETFIAQLGLAPSQIIPVRLAIMFFTA